VWHIGATIFGSFATSAEVQPIGDASASPPSDWLAAAVAPVLDRAAQTVAPLPAALVGVPGPFRRLVNIYLDVTGLGQNWKMFSGPPKVHQYLRVRYYVGPRSGPSAAVPEPAWSATELVMPAHREDQIRFLQSYRDSFRDKAMAIALARFRRAREPDLIRRDTTSAELPDDLAPIGRYFARRFEERNLGPDERVLRTELWYGEAPIPPPGTAPDPALTEERWNVLRGYYEAPVEDHFRRSSYPVYHTVAREGGITWVLEYFEP
jgi:hypothetical protein